MEAVVAVASEERKATERKPNPIGQFFREAISEMRKVVWPSREETTRLTWVVIGISLSVGALLGVLDIAFEALVRFIQQ
jgi:preprotein translocase subunit SecE